MEDKELRKYLKVLFDMVGVVKDQADSNTQRLSAIESGIRSALNAAPQDFERTYATTMAHGQTVASARQKASEFETIRQILAQPPE
jgi:hypothetical protein